MSNSDRFGPRQAITSLGIFLAYPSLEGKIFDESMNQQGPHDGLPKCAVVMAIEGIMVQCDPRRCTPKPGGSDQKKCYLTWAGTTKTSDSPKPALTYESWLKIKYNPTSEIKYLPFIAVIEAAFFFVRNSASLEKARGTLPNLVERLQNTEIAVGIKDGVTETRKAMDFIELENGFPRLKKTEILKLSKHPNSGNGAITIAIYDGPSNSKTVDGRCIILLNHLKHANFYEMKTGCMQLYLDSNTSLDKPPINTTPRTIPGDGIAINIDPEELWELSVHTGVDELLPVEPATCSADQPERLVEFIRIARERLFLKAEIQNRWGFLAEVLGRIVGSCRRLFAAARANVGPTAAAQRELYPGWHRNQLNAAQSGSRVLRSLLFRDTFIFWPMFGLLTAALLLPVFWTMHADVSWVLAAYAGAFLLSSVGSRPCAASVSYAGTGLGGWAFAAFFALSQSCVLGTGFISPESPRLVNSIVGGLIGSRAGLLYHRSPALFIIALVLSSFAIVFAAWGMRGPLQPPNTGKNPAGPLHVGKTLLVLLIGTLPGALIPVELYLPNALGDGVYAVSTVSGLVAGGAFLGCVLISINNKLRAIRDGVVHGLVVGILVLGAGSSTSHLLQFLFGCSATGILHGSIFTLVFLLTRQISGSSSLAAVAAALEGVLGFVGFAVAHIH